MRTPYGYSRQHTPSFNWKWAIGLFVVFLFVSGAFRFIFPLLAVGLVMLVGSAIVFKLFGQPNRGRFTRAWHAQHPHDWRGWYAGAADPLRADKRKRDFAQAVDVEYVEAKPKRRATVSVDDDAVEYVVGADGELEPVRRSQRDTRSDSHSDKYV